MNRWGIAVPLHLQARRPLTMAIKVALLRHHGFLRTEE